jgi:hypothetical protein
MCGIYGTTKGDAVAYNMALVEADFTEPYKGPSDQAYMTKLFEYSRVKASAGYPPRKVLGLRKIEAGPPGNDLARRQLTDCPAPLPTDKVASA